MGDNHHVAGLFVLVMGLLATMQGLRWARWTRHWPVIFLGMAGFFFMRNDPEAWPRGALGFWESLSDPVVFQHRVFVLLIVAFGVFEWSVHLERLRTKGLRAGLSAALRGERRVPACAYALRGRSQGTGETPSA
jgi:putative copper resistance protein D